MTSSTAGWCTLAQLAQQRVHADPGERVERTERLVGQQQLRVADQRAGQRDALLLAAGQLVGPRLLAAGEADLGERLRDRASDASPARRPSVTLSRTRFHGSSRESWKTTDTFSGTLDHAGAGHVAVEAGERPQQRALAASRCGPSSATNSPRCDVEVEAVEHATRLVEAAVQVA